MFTFSSRSGLILFNTILQFIMHVKCSILTCQIGYLHFTTPNWLQKTSRADSRYKNVDRKRYSNRTALATSNYLETHFFIVRLCFGPVVYLPIV